MNLLRADIDAMNDDIKSWTQETKSSIIGKMNSLGIKHYRYSQNPIPLQQALKTSLRKRNNLTDRISFKMPRSAIFLHKGVSRGHSKNNPRQAKEFFNDPVEKQMPKLGDIVANHQGNLIVNNLNIK
jgi:hypothetical protein